jgi:hypothetical protein
VQTSDQLFDLVHSLKKEEKRHFKLYAKKYKKASNYLQLFDAIANLKHYDEKQLRIELNAAAFMERLPVAKEYLYTLILRSLRDLEPATPEGKVLKMIEDSTQLLNRRMFAASKKQLRKAQEIAREHDLIGEQLLLGNLEGYLPDNDRDHLFSQEGDLLRSAIEIHDIGKFAEALRQFKESKGAIRSEADTEDLDRILATCQVSNPDLLSTFSAKMRYHFGWFMHNEIVDDQDDAIQSLKAIVTLYDANPQHIHTQQLAYISIVMSLASRLLERGEFEHLPEYLKRVRTLQANEQMKPYCELLLFRFSIDEASSQKNWKRINTLHDELDNILARYATEVNSFGKDIRIDYYLGFAKAYFLQHHFEKALNDATQLMRLPTLHEYPYQESNVRLLLIVIHYELGNLSYLPYLIRSTYRALLRRERLFEFEACILRYLGSVSRLKKRRDVLPSFEKLLAEITLLTRQPIDREFPWREFYVRWLEKKITEMKN